MNTHKLEHSLFPGEVLDQVTGHPCVYKYHHRARAADSQPLVVFIPGGAHLARVAYGGHPGSREQDFLAHWLDEEGFGFLAISYPLETASATMPATCPDFRVSDWGQQAAAVTKKIVDAHKLTPEVILVAWSMGGRIVVPFTKAAQALGLQVDLFISLASTPGLPGLSGGNPGPSNFRCSEYGYASAPILLNIFVPQIRAQAELNQSRPIIPEDIYLRDYYGNTPVSMLGWLLKHGRDRNDDHVFVDDQGQSIKDSEATEFAAWPWIATLYPDSEQDHRHTIADKSTWNFLSTLRMLAVVEKVRKDKGSLEAVWKDVTALIATIPDKLCNQIEGNHYFFIGEQGARATARAIRKHWEISKVLRSEFSGLLGLSPREL